MAVDPSYWRGKRVFITGHTGFKGSWLCLLLTNKLGAQVYGFSDTDSVTTPCLWEQINGDQYVVESMLGDVRDEHALQAAMLVAAPEIVIHMAARSIVGECAADPAGAFAVNTMGTVNLMEAVRRTKSVRTVLIVSTDHVYAQDGNKYPKREIDAVDGLDLYGKTKAAAEFVAEAYMQLIHGGGREITVVVARAGNVIGGGDYSPGRLLPDLVRAWSQREPARLNRPDVIRPWQHVLEPLVGYLRLIEKADPDTGLGCSLTYNFGPSIENMRSVHEVASGAAAAWAAIFRHEAKVVVPTEASWAPDIYLDSTLARRELGHVPRWTLPEAIGRVIGWHYLVAMGEPPSDACQLQIDDYFQVLKE